MAELAEVNDQNFVAEVLQSDKPVVVDFWAEWCAPCRQIKPIIKELAQEYADRVKVVTLDVDSNPGTAGKFGVRAIPTILAFQGGQVMAQLQGARPRRDFEEMVEKLV